MSCQDCVFYSRSSTKEVKLYSAKEGMCTRFPTHVKVQERHFCGELILNLNSCYNLVSEAEVPFTVSRRVTDSVRLKEQREERKTEYDLKKEIKALRELYKEKTGKSAVIRKSKNNT